MSTELVIVHADSPDLVAARSTRLIRRRIKEAM